MPSSSPVAPRSSAESTPPPAGSRAATTVLAVALAALCAASWVWSTGGFRASPLGVVVSVRSPWPAACAGLVLFSAWWWKRRGDAAADAKALERRLRGHARRLALAIAMATFATGLVYGSIVAGGADSSGYLSQAELWRRGSLVVEEPAILDADSQDAAWVYSPLGFRPGQAPGTIVPSYPPGLPVQFALAGALGHAAVAAVVPILGAAAVWLTYVLGRRLDGVATGLTAALLLACSPAFLYQLVQPMSDVPVTAWWLAVMAVLLTRPAHAGWVLAAGTMAGVAVATRPNLVPLVLVPLLLLWRPRALAEHDAADDDAMQASRRLAWFAVGLAPAVVLLAWFNTVLYGAPWSSGYGDTAQLFAAANVGVNIERYGRWLIDTHLALLVMAAAGMWTVFGRHGDRRQRRFAVPLVLAAALVCACYVAYAPFDSWTYLRFLLPAIAVLAVFGGLTVKRLALHLPPPIRLAVIVVSVTLLASHGVVVARAGGTFELATREQRYRLVAEWVRDHMPPDTLVVCAQHSGSIHQVSGRSVLRWDTVDPWSLNCDWVDCARPAPADRPTSLPSDLASRDAFRERAGKARTRPWASRPLVIVLDADEEAPFRERMSAAQPFGALDWPPRATTRAPASARVYLVRDRDAYQSGGSIPTDVLSTRQ